MDATEYTLDRIRDVAFRLLLQSHAPFVYIDIPEASWLACTCGWQVPEYEGGSGRNYDENDDWVEHFLKEVQT